MGIYASILSLFPKTIKAELEQLCDAHDLAPEEIRVRRGQAVCIRTASGEHIGRCVVTEQMISHILMNATNGSFHSAAEALRSGYLPLPNGCRMGICGEGAMGEGALRNVRNISSLCLRIAHPAHGCADTIFLNLTEPVFRNTIIIAPPGKGKTTLLRELIRKLSASGQYVCVADERGEISGMYRGDASFDLGPRSDIAFGIPKQQAAMMLLRGMAPDILAMDEITAVRDMPAIMEAMGCGVGLLTTMHGNGTSALKKTSFLPIVEAHAFERAVVICVEKGKRRYFLEELI